MHSGQSIIGGPEVKETSKRVPLRRVVTGFDEAGKSVVAQGGVCDFMLAD
jgi:hypothetical protein